MNFVSSIAFIDHFHVCILCIRDSANLYFDSSSLASNDSTDMGASYSCYIVVGNGNGVVLVSFGFTLVFVCLFVFRIGLFSLSSLLVIRIDGLFLFGFSEYLIKTKLSSIKLIQWFSTSFSCFDFASDVGRKLPYAAFHR